MGSIVSQLLYADDVLLFAEATSSTARHIRTILDCYCGWTRQVIHYGKSSIMFSKHMVSWRMRFTTNLLGFKKVKEFDYLGIRLAMRPLRKVDFEGLTSKLHSKLSVWGSKHLSLAGKLTLLDSAFLSLPLFLLSNCHLPHSVLHLCERFARCFL